MRNIQKIVAATVVFALAACGQPAATSAAVTLVDPWAAATPSGATVGGGYVTIRNDGDTADRLVSAESARAGHVELHQMSMEGSMMRMAPVTGIDVPAHGEATLAPGGYHIMFIAIPTPFVEGETVPVTLHFQRQGDVQANFVVRARQASGG